MVILFDLKFFQHLPSWQVFYFVPNGTSIFLLICFYQYTVPYGTKKILSTTNIPTLTRLTKNIITNIAIKRSSRQGLYIGRSFESCNSVSAVRYAIINIHWFKYVPVILFDLKFFQHLPCWQVFISSLTGLPFSLLICFYQYTVPYGTKKMLSTTNIPPQPD
jgi:hypothetical protein